MTPYPEVLLWREYSLALGVTNAVEVGVQRGNYAVGATRSLIESFVMADGKPIYSSSHTYDDSSLDLVRKDRDPRIFIFLKSPGQLNIFKNEDNGTGDMWVRVEPDWPDLTNGAEDWRYTTGYALRKGGTFDRSLCGNWKGYTAAISFRATEALLNYMEAQYMLTKNISSGKTVEYWKAIREAAGFTGSAVDPQTTINATDMSRETLDWAAYTAGHLLSDATLFNIRRERRSELMGEGLRAMDLKRWRSYEQMKTTAYHVEGIHLWGTPFEGHYQFRPEQYNGSNSAVVSNSALSTYLRPHEINMTSGNLVKDGYTWSMAHYLQPLPIKQFQLTSSDHTSVELSPLYQNPYWPIEPNLPAEQ